MLFLLQPLFFGYNILWRLVMEIQFVTDVQGKRTAAIIPFEEWERTEKAKDILEHVYLAGIIKERKNSKTVYLSGIIKERKNSKTTVSLDELLKAEELTRAELEG
jgi:hypothetical protein